jgi:hypothetical protein
MSRSYKPRANRENIPCARCKGTIPAYAGRPLSEYGSKFLHHPGQCDDAAATTEAVRKVAAEQGSLFGWACTHHESSKYDDMAEVCNVIGWDRGEYAAHMKTHGKTPIKAEPKIRLRRKPPAAKLPPVEVPVFKTLRWTKRTYSDWTPEHGQTFTESEHRGQFWSNGPDPHSVIAITYTPYGSGQRPELITLYLRADGSVTPDWSDAKQSRREGNRLAKRVAA